MHGIHESARVILGLHDHAIGPEVPLLLLLMAPINVTEPSKESMVPLPNKEHPPLQGIKIALLLEEPLECLILLPPQRAPRSHNLLCDLLGAAEVVVDGDVHASVTLAVAIHELILQSLHVHLIDGADKGKADELAERNLEPRFLLWLDEVPTNNVIGVVLSLLPKSNLPLLHRSQGARKCRLN